MTDAILVMFPLYYKNTKVSIDKGTQIHAKIYQIHPLDHRDVYKRQLLALLCYSSTGTTIHPFIPFPKLATDNADDRDFHTESTGVSTA